MRIARRCSHRRFIKSLVSSVFALTACLCVPSTSAFASNLDQRIEFWVHEAPLAIVIEQIAFLSGRSVDISGAIEGTVSGTFDNSLLETLTSFSGEYELLFDIDADTLYAITNHAKSVASVEVFSAKDTQDLQDEWRSASLPGSRFVINDGRVNLSGHPAFVHRITQALSGDRVKAIGASVASVASVKSLNVETTSKRLEIPEPTPESLVLPAIQKGISGETEFPEASINSEISQQGDQAVMNESKSTSSEINVSDAVVTVQETIIEEFVAADVEPAEKSSESGVESDDINWVTEIPGFSTF